MTRRTLPNTRTALNAAANNGQINYFITPPELADYWFAKITEASLAGFRGKLLDYYVEASDSRGNLHRSEIQHVFVEDDGSSGGGTVTAPPTPGGLSATVNGSSAITLSWAAASGATSYQVFRDGSLRGTTSNTTWPDSGLSAATSYSYTVVAANSAGNSAPSSSLTATTAAAGTTPAPFAMDGVADSAGYLLSNPGMTIHAALRGSKLYVATWAPGAFGNDHFILIGGSVMASTTTAAPWAKAGTIALPTGSPFLAAESSNTYIGWANANGATPTTARGANGQQMEGTIDLAAFGAVPPFDLYLAALAYQTADGGLLGSQAPAGNANGNVDPAEFLCIPLEALRDEDANGTYDRLEPANGFHITAATRADDGFLLRWNSFPGRSYQVQSAETLEPASWDEVPGSTVVATGLITETTLNIQPGEAQRFFRVVLLP
jgi:hypothetical protein